MTNRNEIIQAFDVSDISEAYPGPVYITDLKDELGTKGHVLVVRGDKAYEDSLGDNSHLANPKFWLYENLINSPRVQEQLRENPNHKLFDGVGYSSLKALDYHTNQIGREVVVVMAREMYDKLNTSDYPNIEIIRAKGSAEKGYVEMQKEVLKERNDIIPLHQALNGARSLAPIGNSVIRTLEEMCVIPDKAFFVGASGSNMYGIGTKIRDQFPNCRVALVEPEDKRTVDPDLDLSNPEAVKRYSIKRLKLDLEGWDGKYDEEFFPLHMKHPNLYLLQNWIKTGDTQIDEVIGVSEKKAKKIRKYLRGRNQDYNWTGTTNMALVPAVNAAKRGENVLVMAYGRNNEPDKLP